MTSLIVTLGLITLIAGIALAIAAFRGRWVNRHPYCKRCGFDLTGLDLTEPANCPECGRTVRSGTESIKIGKRKRRPILLVAGLLLALLGTTGVAWPQIAQLPSIRNIDWYAHLPESMLINMTIKGNKDARSVINDRLIPGEVSEEGLASLIDHAMAMLDDESVPWDEWWGDVIVWGMLTSRMTHEQVGAFAEATMYAEIRTRPAIRASDESIAYTLGVYGDQRGAAVSFLPSTHRDSRITKDWERFSGMKNPWSIEVSTQQVWIDQPPRIEMSGAWMSLSEWAPVNEDYFERAALARIPEGSQGSITLNSNARFTLKHGGYEVHSWAQTLTAAVGLSGSEVQYAVPFTDPVEIDRYVSTLNASFVQYPRNRMLGRLIAGTKDCQRARTIIVHSIEKPLDGSVSALFDLYVRVDGEEILFALLDQGADQSLEFERGRSESRNMLDYFDEHQELWSRAEEQGHVDLILRPNPDLAALDPRHTQYIDAEIIFREVPLMILDPRDTGHPSPAGTTWSWVKVPRRTYPSIKGELIKD